MKKKKSIQGKDKGKGKSKDRVVSVLGNTDIKCDSCMVGCGLCKPNCKEHLFTRSKGMSVTSFRDPLTKGYATSIAKKGHDV